MTDSKPEEPTGSGEAEAVTGRQKSGRGTSTERVFVGTGMFWGMIVGFVLALAVLILAVQNTGTIAISFLGWDFSIPLIVVILSSLLIGIVLAELFGLVYRRRRRRALSDRDELRRLQ